MCQSAAASKSVVICVGLHSLGKVLVITLRSYHLLGTNLLKIICLHKPRLDS